LEVRVIKKDRDYNFVARRVPRNRKVFLVVQGDEAPGWDEIVSAVIGTALIGLAVVELLWLPLFLD
jgi:hypothetical protein